jgi:hypothetical protein
LGLNWPIFRLIHIYGNYSPSFIYRYFDRLYIISAVDAPIIYYCNIRLLYSKDEGDSWTSIDSLTPTIVGYGDPRLSASTNGRMAFSYNIYEPDMHGEDSSYVKISVSSDSGATWSEPFNVSIPVLTNCVPRLDMSGDTIVVCWYSSYGFTVRKSTNLGQTWLEADTLGRGEGDIALDNSIIHVVYKAPHKIMYRRWQPGPDNIDSNELPNSITSFQNYPNPFNAETKIEYFLPEKGQVTLEIYNLLGQRLEVIDNKMQETGYHFATWNATGRSSGVYFIRLTTGETSQTHKMVLLK